MLVASRYAFRREMLWDISQPAGGLGDSSSRYRLPPEGVSRRRPVQVVDGRVPSHNVSRLKAYRDEESPRPPAGWLMSHNISRLKAYRDATSTPKTLQLLVPQRLPPEGVSRHLC